jgi:hypothetical protein
MVAKKIYVQTDLLEGTRVLTEEISSDPQFTTRLASLADLLNAGYDYRYKSETLASLEEGEFTFYLEDRPIPGRRFQRQVALVVVSASEPEGQKFLGVYVGIEGYKQLLLGKEITHA